jgi:hypothetical protein
MWICIWKKKLSGQIFITNDVSEKVNLDQLIKFDLGYKTLGCIKTSPNYLDWLRKMFLQWLNNLDMHLFS